MPRDSFGLVDDSSTVISISAVAGFLVLLSLWIAPSCTAFSLASLRLDQTITTISTLHSTNTLKLPATPPFQSIDIATTVLTPTESSLLLVAATTSGEGDIGLDEAFQDTISFTDGPVGVLVAAFAVFVILAVGLKTVMSEMDSAIEKVLEEFETSLKRYYPKRWETIEETSLAGLSGDERDIKLLKVMEELQREEPEFMTKLANRKGIGPGDANE